MKVYILLFSVLILFYSCRSREYIELTHRNYLRLYNDEIRIKISPLKYKDSAVVKISYHEEAVKGRKKFRISQIKKYNNHTIAIKDYRKIISIFSMVKEEDLTRSRSGKDSTGMTYGIFIGAHGGSNSLIYRKGKYLKEFSVQGMSDLHGSFYDVTKLMSESGRVKMEKID